MREWDHEKFEPHIQSIVNSMDGEVFGGELLIRWRQTDGELIPPCDFIDGIKSQGLLPIITSKMMWYTTRKLLLANRMQEKHFHLSVNVTPDLLIDSSFIDNCLALAKIDNIRLILELTEQQQFHMEKSIEHTLMVLADANVTFALDDFGTGCSVLAYLKYFPVSYIKIDKVFTHDFLSNFTSPGSSSARRGAPYRCFASKNALWTAASQVSRNCWRRLIW
ncbi:TPA: EAL domain-containing protein [Escherichia coli]|nr:EAL domain-containing protein [Escherichia coli]